MRRVLVLGGTGWLGGAIARAAIADGAEVVCLARGESGDVPDGATLIRADRGAVGAYEAAAGDWDDVVEVGYDERFVRSALHALADRARHWTLVSTVSVYSRNDEPGADESAELVEPNDLTLYPDAKVAAERATTAGVVGDLLIARPGLIVGPGDPTDRFGYWPARLHRGGHVLAPLSTGRHAQVIDVDDLAEWIVRAGRDGVTGVVNAVGPVHPLDDVLGEMAAATGFDGELVTVDDAWLVDQGVAHWAGPRSMPLWVPIADDALMQRDDAAFRAAGGSTMPLRATIERALADEIARGVDRVRHAGLDSEEEALLLRLAEARHGQATTSDLPADAAQG